MVNNYAMGAADVYMRQAVFSLKRLPASSCSAACICLFRLSGAPQVAVTGRMCLCSHWSASGTCVATHAAFYSGLAVTQWQQPQQMRRQYDAG